MPGKWMESRNENKRSLNGRGGGNNSSCLSLKQLGFFFYSEGDGSGKSSLNIIFLLMTKCYKGRLR